MSSSKSKHPSGLYVLFFSEMWERFSFYGMRALLVLYMVKAFGFNDSDAYAVYGAYGALVYASPVIGGMLADRIMGARLAVILGGVLMSLGHFTMAVETPGFLYFALALICAGNGFFKANISSMVGKLYKENDPLRDSGFTIFYMGINIGAFTASVLCGYVGQTFGWHYGFGMAGVGMIIGLITFIRGQKYLGNHGLPPNPKALKQKLFGNLVSREKLIYLGTALAVPVIALGLYRNEAVGWALNLTAIAILGYLLFVAFSSGKVARDRLILVMLLMIFHTTFWAFFEQAGSSLTLFADRNVDRSIFGWEMPASMAQAFNPFFIIALGPVFVWLWGKLAALKKTPSIPIKFAYGIFGVGLGFYALVFGSQFAGPDAQTGLIFLVLAYFLHTAGELFISPIGLSAVTKLSPAKVVSTVMGAWFLSISFAHHIAALIAKLTGVKGSGDTSGEIDASQSLGVYVDVFGDIFTASAVIGIILVLISPLLKKLAHGVR